MHRLLLTMVRCRSDGLGEWGEQVTKQTSDEKGQSHVPHNKPHIASAATKSRGTQQQHTDR
jgi:hypothetical protein